MREGEYGAVLEDQIEGEPRGRLAPELRLKVSIE